MRVLLLSDIHSNLEALEACLAAAPAYDRVLNLGDVVGYGANPNEVVTRSRELGEIFVRGNHDKAVSGLADLQEFNPIAGLAALWNREQLTNENMEWLRGLPRGPLQVADLPGIEMVHGSPLDEDEYLVTPQDAVEPLLLSSTPLVFFGHTHLQGGFTPNGAGANAFYPIYRTIGQAETSDYSLEPGIRHLINPGSVGQPRDGDWRAAFALFDSDAGVITFCRTPYNLKIAQDKILAANLPPRLATRLAAGR